MARWVQVLYTAAQLSASGVHLVLQRPIGPGNGELEKRPYWCCVALQGWAGANHLTPLWQGVSWSYRDGIDSVWGLRRPHNAVNCRGSLIVMRQHQLWNMVKCDVSCRDEGGRPHKIINLWWGFLELPGFFFFQLYRKMFMQHFCFFGEIGRTFLWWLVSVVDLTQCRVT